MRTHRAAHTLTAVALVIGMLSPFATSAQASEYDGVDTTQRSRALTEAACAQAGDVAAALTQNLQALQGEMWRAFQQTRIEAERELAPLMHRFADQLRDLARQLDTAPVPHDS